MSDDSITPQFRDFLQELADMKRRASIRYRSVEGGIATLQAHIIGFESEGGREMINTDAGITIGVDQLLEVNGRQSENYC